MSAQDSMVQIAIDGAQIAVPEGTTIFDAARTHGIPIPTLCHQQNETPVGVCRICVVETGRMREGKYFHDRVLAASCARQLNPFDSGLVISTHSEEVRKARRTLLDMLMADHPSPCARQKHTHDCELETLARAEGIEKSRFPQRLSPRGQDSSSLIINVDHEACILCDRCIRGCDEIKHNNVLGRTRKGYQAGIAFDLNVPMASSTCVSCGECMVSCPTGALTNKGLVGAHLGEGQALGADELHAFDFLKGVSGTFLELNRGAVVRRKFKAGDTVCREGEFGATAFYLEQGRAKVFLATPIAHLKTEGGATGFLSVLKSRLTGRQEHQREEESDDRSIPIDAPVDLSYSRPVAELGPGALLGELTCLNFYPRSATVVALDDCTMLEMNRNVLDMLRRNKNFRERLDQQYILGGALNTHLRNVKAFAGLTDEFINEHLRDKVELVRYEPKSVIIRQGDAAGSLYVIRTGFVKVSQQHMGGELVLAYLSRGDYFGEISLLSSEGRAVATCTAVHHVDAVRIRGDDFRQLTAHFPEIRSRLETVAQERLEQNRRRLETASESPLDSFLAQGLLEARSLLILDLERCTRCDACVRACADAHQGITRLVREGLRFDKYLVATSCRQCRDPLCMVGCPVGSIRRRNSLEVIIEDWCIGCGLCAQNCPYGNITMHPIEALPQRMRASLEEPGRVGVKRKATSCDLCTEHAEPSCVYACPHDAAHRVDAGRFFAGMLK
jgi:CRP-like cAMP-binding protein/Pyruvate/2-oxoacid:ferredoxin oxidoreductase delta subunit